MTSPFGLTTQQQQLSISNVMIELLDTWNNRCANIVCISVPKSLVSACQCLSKQCSTWMLCRHIRWTGVRFPDLATPVTAMSNPSGSADEIPRTSNGVENFHQLRFLWNWAAINAIEQLCNRTTFSSINWSILCNRMSSFETCGFWQDSNWKK